jgi:hypothetical protein
VRRSAAFVALLCSSPALGAQPFDGGERSVPTVRPTAPLQLDATGTDCDVRAVGTINVRRARLEVPGELSPDLAYASISSLAAMRLVALRTQFAL